jgi:DNA-binding SARP family transcriptional activator
MLVLSPNRVVSGDRLMEGLWGEHPPASAGKMVQLMTHVHTVDAATFARAPRPARTSRLPQ